MNNKLKIIIGLIIFLFMPVLFAYIIAKAVANHDGKTLITIFVTLMVLEIISVIIKVVNYNKNKKEKK